MPYIAYNGQLYEVSQAEYDSYTAGSPLPSGAVLTNPGNVAAGGTVTENNSATTPILVENTTNNTPGQTLTTTYQETTTANVTTVTDSTTTANVVTISDSLVASSANSVYASSTAGLTVEQLLALGGADPTDPYIRARLGLPALSEVQTLSNAIGNISVANISNAVSNVATSFGNAVSNISFGDIGNTFSNVATSFGNAVSDINLSNIGNAIGDYASAFGNSVSNIGDYFSGNTATTVADSAVNTINTTTIDQLASGQITADQAAAAAAVAENQATTTDSTTVDTATADAGSGTTVGTTTTDAVPANQIDTAPADVSSAVDPQASLAAGEEIVPTNEVNYSPGELDAIAAGQGVAGEQGNITADTLARDPGSFTAAELNAIADAQGVAGEQGNITADTLARDPGSLTADELNAISAAQGVAQEGDATLPTATDAPVDSATDPQAASADTQASNSSTTDTTNTGTGTSADGANALSNIQGLVRNAQQQQTIADQRKQINNGDWRVRLRLAPQSNYLYNAQNPGIMQPLRVTDGIIFPYTPQIDTNYRANYESYDLTHSNYRGYFYKNSYVDSISLKAQFTAQDTNDANYLLAVITFLKSATKMFYGQDAQRGAPPPLVYLSGFGDYQFREHACVISAFQYNLPDNVDYIRAGSPNNVGLNLTSIRDRQSVATNSIFSSINRLAAAFLPKGGQAGAVAPPTLGLNRPTYVPTKMDINLTLLPMQSRQQVSKQFSLKEFANGNLIKGGFW